MAYVHADYGCDFADDVDAVDAVDDVVMEHVACADTWKGSTPRAVHRNQTYYDRGLSAHQL